MEKNMVYRIVIVVGVVLVALFSLVPTYYYDYDRNESKLPEWWIDSKVLPTNHLVLGLDLQGGMDLLISVNAHEAVVSELRHYKDVIKSGFERNDIQIKRLEVDAKEKKLLIEYADKSHINDGQLYIRRYAEGVLVAAEGKDTLTPVYVLQDRAQRDLINKSVEQVKEVISRRIDGVGLKEPEIVIQGDNNIRLQLPGVKDPERIKELLSRSAKLEFLIVESVGLPKASAEEEAGGPPPGMVLATWTSPTNPDRKVECYFPTTAGVSEGPVPALRRLVPGKAQSSQGGQEAQACYLLKEDRIVSGRDLKDARPTYDNSSVGANKAIVSFQFNMQGAQEFAAITGDNIGNYLAIVLEGYVMSAPVIRDKIFSRGQISGTFTPQEATDLANVLRSGALDVSIKIEEERTVGASLGADSIHKGQNAIIIGGVVVVIFMVIYYVMAGIIADVALTLNLVLIMAILSMFGATLTLPGLAGIVLTVGMAVDANVLIFERVREEIRTGKTPAASIDAGYGKALWTILDANITTLIAALVLLQWGTGPIKGFAVTLTIGVVSSMFTAIVVTRLIYDLLFYFRRGMKISIGMKLDRTNPAAGN